LLTTNQDVSARGMNPLDHYLRYGAAEGRKPGPMNSDQRSNALALESMEPKISAGAEAGIAKSLTSARVSFGDFSGTLPICNSRGSSGGFLIDSFLARHQGDVTIGDVIEQHAAQRPEHIAIVGSDFAPLSFQALSLQIRTVGEQLRAAGIGSSARVGIVLPKGPEVALLSLSIACHAISVPLNPVLTPTELEEEMTRLDLDALVL